MGAMDSSISSPPAAPVATPPTVSTSKLSLNRSTSLLSAVPIESVIKFYKPHAHGKYISIASFRACTSDLLATLGASVGASTLRVYDLIWSSLPRHPVTSLPTSYVNSVIRNLNPRNLDRTLVDMGEVASMPALVAALTVVCGGTRSSKVSAAFRMFDGAGNGEISLNEMTTYLKSVFDCMNKLGDEGGGTEGASKLAKELAIQAFQQADKGNDGTITQTEFKEWYESPDEEGTKRVTENDAVTMAMVRKMVGLDKIPVKTLFEIFAEGADSNGVIDRSTFHSCFDVIMSSTLGSGGLTALQSSQAGVQISRLFDVFASDESPLAVSFDEVASGLSIMAGGDRDDKVRAAFELYDINDDGFISFDEVRGGGKGGRNVC